jgi:hypothetical protein
LPVYERAQARGRMLPPGLAYIDSWIDEHLGKCFQLMETDDPTLFDEWTASWSDLVDFETAPVISTTLATTRVIP